MLDERSIQTVSTPFNILKNKGNVESMLNESLNEFQFDSTHFQRATLSTMLNDLFKRPRVLVLVEANVETVLNGPLPLTCKQGVTYSFLINILSLANR